MKASFALEIKAEREKEARKEEKKKQRRKNLNTKTTPNKGGPQHYG